MDHILVEGYKQALTNKRHSAELTDVDAIVSVFNKESSMHTRRCIECTAGASIQLTCPHGLISLAGQQCIISAGSCT